MVDENLLYLKYLERRSRAVTEPVNPAVRVAEAGDPAKARYHRFRDYLQARYGRRIHKISLDAGFGCPHREGLDHRQGQGCVYCENAAFSPNARKGAPPPPLEEQLSRGILFGGKRYRAQGFFAYFQAYTNTFGPLESLEQAYGVIRGFSEVVGLAVGTRPDCAGDPVLDLLESFSRDYEVWVEYGLQSACNRTLDRIRRGHTVQDFIDAVERTARRPIRICAHVILGLPGETRAEMMETAKLVARLPVQGVKIHHCHVIRGTPLAESYQKGEYHPLGYNEYLRCVCDFLEILPWPITIQRLLGEAPRDLLLAPDWGRDKGRVLAEIQAELERRETRQGARSEEKEGCGEPD
jgi:radical SAM protein (TIGR01212 family)